MSLVKGIASVVGLGGIATAIGLGVSSSSSSPAQDTPKLKKTTVGERLSSGEALHSFLGFDSVWDAEWKSNFRKYEVDSNKFGSTISDWQGLRDQCKKIHDSEIDESDSNLPLFKQWCVK